jgi:hypothetical protein
MARSDNCQKIQIEKLLRKQFGAKQAVWVEQNNFGDVWQFWHFWQSTRV